MPNLLCTFIENNIAGSCKITRAILDKVWWGTKRDGKCVKPCFCGAAGHSGLGGFPAARRQPVSLSGEEEGRDQDVCSPLLQGVAHLERGRRKDQVPV